MNVPLKLEYNSDRRQCTPKYGVRASQKPCRVLAGAGCSFSDGFTRSSDDFSLAGSLVLLLVPRTPWFIMFFMLITEPTDDSFSSTDGLASFRSLSTVVKVVPSSSACASGIPRRERGVILGGAETLLV